MTATTHAVATFPARAFARDADDCARRAVTHAANATRAQAAAHRAAADLPADWTSPGGAPAGTLLALIDADTATTRRMAEEAREAADRAAQTDDAVQAARCAEAAHCTRRSAQWDAESVQRFLEYLTGAR